MTKIALYGNLVVDRVIDRSTFVESHTLGGIANAWIALKYFLPDAYVDLVPTSVGEAVILSDLQNSVRTSKAQMNIRVNGNIPRNEASWHHIMYLNSIHNLEFLKGITSGNISADITTNPIKNLEYLKYIDYLFVSDEDVSITFDELVEKTKGWVIMHNSTGSMCSNGEIMYDLSDVVDYVDGINVLGAGDIFASAFIASYNVSVNIKDIVSKAHKNTTKMLIEGEK